MNKKYVYITFYFDEFIFRVKHTMKMQSFFWCNREAVICGCCFKAFLTDLTDSYKVQSSISSPVFVDDAFTVPAIKSDPLRSVKTHWSHFRAWCYKQVNRRVAQTNKQ